MLSSLEGPFGAPQDSRTIDQDNPLDAASQGRSLLSD